MQRGSSAPAAPTVAKKRFMSNAAIPSADGISGCRGRGMSVATATARSKLWVAGCFTALLPRTLRAQVNCHSEE
jgi:hypothetical protein